MQLLRPRHAAAGVAAVTALVLAGCSSSAPSSGLMADGSVATSSGAALSGTLNAGGSTFQLTFQEEAVSGFKAVQPNMTVNYNGVGSGAGRNDLAADKVNMAASDSPIPSQVVQRQSNPAMETNCPGRIRLPFVFVTLPPIEPKFPPIGP